MAGQEPQRVGGGAETHFAKKLASNEKTVRDRAVKKLRVWISTRRSVSSGLSEKDLLKLWKGLFYCMWMSDKPKVQEELAGTIAQLLHSFHGTNSAIDFLTAFFQTMCREWHGIDRLRLDKFYLLIRKFIHQSIVFLKNHDWDDETISLLNTALENGPLTSINKSTLNDSQSSKSSSTGSTQVQIPEGIQVHITQVYLEEVFKVGTTEIPNRVLIKLLEPFINLLATSKSKVLSRCISQRIFKQLLEKAGKDEENGNLELDFKALAEQFFSWASRQDIPTRNRNILYDYIKKFKKFSCEKTGDEAHDFGGSSEITHKSETFIGKMLNNGDGNVNDLRYGTVHGEEYLEEKGKTTVGPKKNDCLDLERTKKSDTKKIKEKKVRKRKHKDETENTNGTAGQSTDVSGCETSTGIKRSKSDKNNEAKHHFETGQKVNSSDGGKKKMKTRKNEMLFIANGDHEAMRHVNQQDTDNSKESELVEEDHYSLDGSYLSTLVSEKRRLYSEKSAKVETGGSKRVKATHCNGKDNGLVITKKDTLFRTARATTNESNAFDYSTASESSERATATKFAQGQVDKPKDRQRLEVLNTIPGSPPFSMFLRHSITKAKINTEPKKKGRQRLISTKVNGHANSDPGNRRKQVRIELSKNTSHSTKDYRQSLKSSPTVPFDATKKPTQSSLKTPSKTEASHSKSTGNASQSLKRPSAADFF